MKHIPYGRQDLDRKDIKAVVRALKSAWITQGPAIEHFEQTVAHYTGAKHAVAVSNGTTALHIAYLAAGIKAGDEVIVPANTFAATSNAALYIGAKPVFADIEMEHYNIDPKDIERRITPRTKAIIPVHFSGHPCDMDAIMKIAKKHKLIVFEDGAHALGAKYKRHHIGQLKTAGVMFSFHPVKSITTGEGGMVTTNDKDVFTKLKSLRSHGISKDARGMNVMTELGYNYRMTDFQAALGTSQMRRLNDFIKQRHQVVKWYQKHLGKIQGIILPSEDSHVVSAWHLYVIRTVKASDRDKLYKALQDNHVGANFHYPPVYWHPYYKSIGYRGVKLPNAELYGKTAITIPLHTKLKEGDIKHIAGVIKKYFAKS